jgi:uncharacterized membrane protein
MRKSFSLPLYLVILIDILVVALLIYLAPRFIDALNAWLQVSSAGQGGTTVEARVVALLEEGVIAEMGTERPYQLVQVEAVEGRRAGETFTIDYGQTTLSAPGTSLDVGDRVMIGVDQGVDGAWQAYFVDFVRTRALLWLLGLFVLASILLSGWKGVRSMASMLFSFAVIVFYILPNILAGENPVAVSTTGAFIILAVTLYLVYGWTLKTHAAVLGVLTALSITGLLAYSFIDLTHLTGFGSEETMFLSQQMMAPIDLRGLVLSGILIGALGVLDDLVITQASAVFELHLANPALSFARLYRQSMRIGQDHVAATVNTLVLAYTGAALPLLLLVSQGGEQFGTFINREFVTEEIVRTLVGSLGLIAAVPLTTGLACLVVLHHGRLGRLRPLLGPVSLGEGHGHHHHH